MAKSAPPLEKSFDMYALLPTLLTILAAVIGYAIVERFARRREARTDLRAIASSFREAVDSVLADAVAFYQLPGGSPRARALATSIKSKIASLPDIIDAIQQDGVAVQVDDELKLFRQTLTGGQFDSMAREPLPSEAALYVDIAAASQQLQRKVDLTFYRALARKPVPWWKRKSKSSPTEG